MIWWSCLHASPAAALCYVAFSQCVYVCAYVCCHNDECLCSAGAQEQLSVADTAVCRWWCITTVCLRSPCGWQGCGCVWAGMCTDTWWGQQASLYVIIVWIGVGVCGPSLCSACIWNLKQRRVPAVVLLHSKLKRYLILSSRDQFVAFNQSSHLALTVA